MPYKKGNVELLQENNLNAEFYREYLEEEFGIHRFEWESCGYEQKFPEPAAGRKMENHLHLPFTRPTLPSTARCMQGVFMETGGSSNL